MQRSHQILALLILAVAALLRFYRLGEFELAHDELSALLRTDFKSFSELIARGVAVDGHPAAVQVFLYYYAPLVQYQAFWLKLPFVLMGLGSVGLLLLMGRSLGNAKAGLLSAACLAVMQNSVLYSQLIRPYGPGLFFSLLAGYFYLRFFFGRRQKKFLYLWAFAAAAMAYTHQFSLLLAGLMAISGFFGLQTTERRSFLLACALAVLLYLPHLPLFFHQLSMGGVESWLAAPGPRFLLQYSAYLFHFSWLFGGVFLAFLLFGRGQKGCFWQGFFWFVASLIIGYLYSVRVNAVLQYSVLLFAFPFLLLSLFSLWQPRWPTVAVVALLLSGSYSLYQNRRHYPLAYQSPFYTPLRTVAAQSTRAVLLHNLSVEKLAFAQNQLALAALKIIPLEEQENYPHLRKRLQELDSTEIFVLWNHQPPLELVPFLQEHYRRVEIVQEGFGFRLMRLRKIAELSGSPHLCHLPDEQGAMDHLSGEKQFGGSQSQQFVPSCTPHPEDFFISQWELRAPALPREAVIATGIYHGDSLLLWQSTAIERFYPGSDSLFSVFHAFRVPQNLRHYDNLELRSFGYSPAGSELSLRPRGWISYRGPRRIYGLVQDF